MAVAAQRQRSFARAHVLADSFDVKVIIAPRADFIVPHRELDPEFFGAAAPVLGHTFGVELAMAIWTFFDLITVSGEESNHRDPGMMYNFNGR